jgi:hypothetical protein
MTDPQVREVATVEDIDGLSVRVGVDYDAVTIGGHRFAGEALVKFRRAFVTADEVARRQGAEMAAAGEPDREAECGYCTTHITLAGGEWRADDWTTACTDTSAPYVPHKPKEADQ